MGGKKEKVFKVRSRAGARYLNYLAFSHDVTAAILVSQNNETAAMLVLQTNPVGVKLLSYGKAFFFPRHFHRR